MAHSPQARSRDGAWWCDRVGSPVDLACLATVTKLLEECGPIGPNGGTAHDPRGSRTRARLRPGAAGRRPASPAAAADRRQRAGRLPRRVHRRPRRPRRRPALLQAARRRGPAHARLARPSTAGGGGSVWDQTVVREEMWAHHEPRGAQYMGLNWVGPAIMAFGTDAQKQQHLPAIAAGDVIWCQGFSEPDAGSDLASLQTPAVEDGDGWRITGQKIWTSYAGMAQWCVCWPRASARASGTRASRCSSCRWTRPASPCGPIRVDARPPPPQRGVLRRRVGRPRPTCSATSARAGR